MCVAAAPAVVAAVVASSDDSNAPRPRLCHVKKWPTFQGYGFNLHAEKGKAGHFIGEVDANSPAECAGLKKGDKIVEVNGYSVREASHADTVGKVKQHADNVKMLVVDAEAEEYYKSRDIIVTGSMANVHHIECPDASPTEGRV